MLVSRWFDCFRCLPPRKHSGTSRGLSALFQGTSLPFNEREMVLLAALTKADLPHLPNASIDVSWSVERGGRVKEGVSSNEFVEAGVSVQEGALTGSKTREKRKIYGMDFAVCSFYFFWEALRKNLIAYPSGAEIELRVGGLFRTPQDGTLNLNVISVGTSDADVVKMWLSVELWKQLCVCVCVLA